MRFWENFSLRNSTKKTLRLRLPRSSGRWYWGERHLIIAAIYVTVMLMSPAGNASADDRPFNNSANWAGTGLMEIPTARVLEDGEMRLGHAQADPYRWLIGGGLGVFPGLEFTGRFTEITNISTSLGGGAYGANKDKAFDIKYQIIPESKKFPAVAVGVHDFWGTALFPAEYVVMSRQIYPFDFTIGLGSKRLKGPISITDSAGPLEDIKSDQLIPDGIGTGGYGLWGGIEWALNHKVHLMAEYNPIEYEKDKSSVRGVPEGAKSPFNVGLRWKVLPGLDLGLSYQRGDTLGLMAHVHFKPGKPISHKRPDPAFWGPEDRRSFKERDTQRMLEQIQGQIQKAGFKDVAVYSDGKILAAEFENNKYISNQKAAGRVLRMLLFYSPAETRRITVIIKRRKIRLLKISVRPEHLEDYLLGQIPESIFYEFVEIEIPKKSHDTSDGNFTKVDTRNKFDYGFGIKPVFDTWLNDPSGVFKARIGIAPFLTADLWKGAAAGARYIIPFYSDISSSNDAPADAVRADAWKFKGEEPTVQRLVFDQVFRLSKKTFARLSGGYLELMYAGIGGELLTYPGDGNLAIGIESDWVKKRVPETNFELMDVDRYSVLGNLYYHFRPFEITFNVKYGRFLGGDIGWRFQVSREYETGFVFGAWLSFTDTDVFSDPYNRGYHDKGVFVRIPLRMFTTYESSSYWNYRFSPWTRDVAQTVGHWSELYSFTSDLMPAEFKSDLGQLKK